MWLDYNEILKFYVIIYTWEINNVQMLTWVAHIKGSNFHESWYHLPKKSKREEGIKKKKKSKRHTTFQSTLLNLSERYFYFDKSKTVSSKPKWQIGEFTSLRHNDQLDPQNRGRFNRQFPLNLGGAKLKQIIDTAGLSKKKKLLLILLVYPKKIK